MTIKDHRQNDNTQWKISKKETILRECCKKVIDGRNVKDGDKKGKISVEEKITEWKIKNYSFYVKKEKGKELKIILYIDILKTN